MLTHHTTASKHDAKPSNSARCPDDPRQPNEQNYSKNILDARQVDADDGTHSRATCCWLSVRVRGGARDRVAVIRQGPQQGGQSWAVIQFFLKHTKKNISFKIVE